MDKYQEKLLQNTYFRAYNATNEKMINDPFKDEILKIFQDEDITNTKYFVLIDSKTISKIQIFENEKYIVVKKESLSKYFKKPNYDAKEFIINFDFNNKAISKIKLHFVNDLADPLEIPVEYVEADKEKYYQKKEKERISLLLKDMSIEHACGNSLVNIRFKNCNELVLKTKVVLFDKRKQLMGTFVAKEEMFFIAITNLAYDSYYYKVEQYDKEDKLIVSTDFINFVIVNPYATHTVFI